MKDRELFLSALEIEDPAARQAHLKSACGEDLALLARVEALLSSHADESRFLNTPVVEQLADPADSHANATMLVGNGSTHDDEIERTAAHVSGTTPMTLPTDTDEEIPLGYLEPSTKPDSLGRLGHYEILQVIGRGAFGTVLRAFDDKLQRVVAIKVLASEMAATSPARKRFLREAQASAAIRHEHVVNIYAVEEKPLPYIVMEYIPGETLQQRLEGRGPLDITMVLLLGRQIAEGLAAAHAQHLIHRDIKPGNILLETGIQDRVKITDFGLARAADDASLTQSGTIAGTPMYMAPEQALGHKLDHRADLFSFGSVLYQMVSGRPPFRAPSALAVLKRVAEEAPRPISEIIPEAPQWLCDIISKLHAKNPDERYQSAQEVADLLGRCQAGLQASIPITSLPGIPAPMPAPVVNAPVNTTPLNTTPRSTGKLITVIVGAVLLLTIGGFLYPSLRLQVANRASFKHLTRDGETLIEFVQDGQVVREQLGFGELELPAGEYSVRITKPENTVKVFNAMLRRSNWLNQGDSVHLESPPQKLTFNAGEHVELYLTYVYTPVAEATPTLAPPDPLQPIAEPTPIAGVQQDKLPSDGWVPLFNGQDLTGWKFHPNHRGDWDVKDGILRGSTRQSHLFSERGDYRNFHLRTEAKINVGGDSGILFRAPFDLRQGRTPRDFGIPGCYEAELQLNRSHIWRTGSISAATGDAPPTSLGQVSDRSLTQPDEWFTIEVIAENNQFISKINGVEVANCRDPLDRYQAGHLALQVWHANTLVQFRKIEIKELLPHAPPMAIAPFDATQAKAHQEAWAKHLGVPVEYTNSLGMTFRLIPPGEFTMGSTEQEFRHYAGRVWKEYEMYLSTNMPPRRVTITKPFFLAVCETTQQQYRAVTKANPSSFVTNSKPPEALAREAWFDADMVKNYVERFTSLNTDLYPVESVQWTEANLFCEKLGAAANMTRNGGCRLPTEAEWEYACRAGSTSAFSFGDQPDELSQVAWLVSNRAVTTNPVEQLRPNAFGLFDMHGNVWEMTSDEFATVDSGRYAEPATDPSFPMIQNGVAARRGGGLFDPAIHQRSASRTGVLINTPHYSIGFRVAASVEAVRQALAATSSLLPNVPDPAIAPVDATQAKAHQEAWAKHLGVPVGQFRQFFVATGHPRTESRTSRVRKFNDKSVAVLWKEAEPK